MKQQTKIAATAIIAVQDGGERLRSCLLAVNGWVAEILVVLPHADRVAEALAKEFGGSVVIHGSTETLELWQEGIRHCKHPWGLLIRSNEVITGQLKKTIWERVGEAVSEPASFTLPRTTVFLRKRFKYPVTWTDCEPSSLIFTGGEPVDLKTIPRSSYPFQRELIHYGEETISATVDTVIELAEKRADGLNAHFPYLAKASLFRKALYSCARNGFRVYFIGGGFKEGFEGLVFAACEVMATLLGCFRYYEKYVRGGEHIAKNLAALRNILVIKLREIGDNVLSTPVIRNLKQSLPHVWLTVLTYNSSRAVFENNPYIDQLLALPKNPGRNETGDLIEILNSKPFDLAVNLHAGKLSTSITEKIDAEFKINQYYIGRDKTGGILVGESDYYRSAIERELDFLRRIGIQPADVKTELFLAEEEIEWAKNYLADQGFDSAKKTVVIHPTASREAKEWGMDRFGGLANALIKENDVQVLATCSPEEKPRLKVLLDYVPGLPVFTGPLRQLLAIIREADLMVGNDSGPGHIAVALDVPTITLLGPNIREIFNDYYFGDDRHFLFYKEVPCRECGLLQCDNKICLDFTVEEVLAKCLDCLPKTRHKMIKSLPRR